MRRRRRGWSLVTCNWFTAGGAPLAEELPEAVSTVGLVVPGGEPLASQGLLTVGAGETLPVPGVVPVGHSALGDHLAALNAFRRELFLNLGLKLNGIECWKSEPHNTWHSRCRAPSG